TPLAERVQRPGRCDPWLTRHVGGVQAPWIALLWEESPTGPLTVRILEGEQPRAEALSRDERARPLPNGRRSTQHVALALPAPCRVRVEQPLAQGRFHGQGG